MFISNSRHHIDLWLNDNVFHDALRRFYIEAGANDGVRDSITYAFQRNLNWSGILVEPIRELYDQCVKNRPNNIYLNCGLGDKVGEATLEIPTDNLDNSSIELSEHHKQVLNRDGFGKSYLKRTINILTYSAMIQKANRSPDLFVLDIEGYENCVLKQMIADGCYLPKVLVVEHDWSDKDLMKQILSEKYILIKEFKSDYVFIRKD